MLLPRILVLIICYLAGDNGGGSVVPLLLDKSRACPVSTAST